jgi:predicted transcriptional regulator
MQRVANLLALLLTRDMLQKEKVVTLAAAGYSSAEIALLVGTTTAVVSQTLYEAKKEKKGKPKRGQKRHAKD